MYLHLSLRYHLTSLNLQIIIHPRHQSHESYDGDSQSPKLVFKGKSEHDHISSFPLILSNKRSQKAYLPQNAFCFYIPNFFKYVRKRGKKEKTI